MVFKVTIIYNNENNILIETVQCTELHYLYKKNMVAFENDIKSCGFTRCCSNIDSIDITL